MRPDQCAAYVNSVIKRKLLESRTLQQQAANNTKEQCGHLANLRSELDGAIMDALDAHTTMSLRALSSQRVRDGILDILLNQLGLWEALRERSGGGAERV